MSFDGLEEMLQQAGYKAEVSTSGDAPIYEGVYKATLVDVAKMEDQGYGESVYAQFKINEVLAGRESHSKYPEFKDYYSIAPDRINNKKSGLAKLLNGLFSVKVEVSPSQLENAKGAELFINGYKAKKFKKNDDGTFSEIEGEYKQGYAFMTEKNALAKAEKLNKGKGDETASSL